MRGTAVIWVYVPAEPRCLQAYITVSPGDGDGGEVTVSDAGRGTIGRVVPKLGMLLLYEASDGVALEDASPGLVVRMAFNMA